MWSKASRYARISREGRRMLWEALAALAGARVAMALLPFRRIAAWLGTAGAESPATATAAELAMAKKVGWAVRSMARWVPWDGRCLAQAIAATAMLRRRGLEGTVSFGGRANETAKFQAHAWLRLGPYLVTGGGEHLRYKTFTSFARTQS